MANKFEHMYLTVKSTYPQFSDEQCHYLCNKISNKIHSCNTDIYQVSIGGIPEEWIYFEEFTVKVGSTNVAVYFLVD